jgi:hypothetical protein
MPAITERQELAWEEIYADGFEASDGDNADLQSAWAECAHVLGIPPGILRPSDKLEDIARQMRWKYVFRNRLDDLEEYLIESLPPELRPTRVTTVRDAVLALAKVSSAVRASNRNPA